MTLAPVAVPPSKPQSKLPTVPLLRPVDPHWHDVLGDALPAGAVLNLYMETRGDNDTLATWIERHADDPYGGIYDMEMFATQVIEEAMPP